MSLWGHSQQTWSGIGFDGIGTKIDIAERMGTWHTLAFDLFAMVCDDAVVQGAEPALLGTVLDVRTLGTVTASYVDCVRQLADGYAAAAAVARVAVVNGEIAECGARISGYGPFNLTWNAGVVWFARRSRLLSGAAVRSGDAIVGLEETGCRSNGYSLLRHIVQRRHGDAWHTVACGDTTPGRWLCNHRGFTLPRSSICSVVCMASHKPSCTASCT